MSNPVTPFRNKLFGSRVTIQEALNYCESLINTLSIGDQAAIRVGFGVLLNTIDDEVTTAKSSRPEMDQADMLSQLGGMYDKLVNDVAAKVSAQDQENLDYKISGWMDEHLREKMMDVLANEDIDDDISNWMSNNFDITDYDVDGSIESWMDNNLQEKVEEAIGNVEFNVTVR